MIAQSAFVDRSKAALLNCRVRLRTELARVGLRGERCHQLAIAERMKGLVAISEMNHIDGSLIFNVWFSSRSSLTTCFRPDGQSTSTLSIFVASPRPK